MKVGNKIKNRVSRDEHDRFAPAHHEGIEVM